MRSTFTTKNILLFLSIIVIEIFTFSIYPFVECKIKNHEFNIIPLLYILLLIFISTWLIINVLKSKKNNSTSLLLLFNSLVLLHGIYKMYSIECCPGG